MPRYKDCDKCYHRCACAGDTDKWNYYGECPHYIAAADVAPRAEVIAEYRKKVYAKMEKYTVFGREYIQRIMREVENEMKGGEKDV